MSDDNIWYNKTTWAYAFSTAIKGRYLVTYFISVPAVQIRSSDPTESQKPYKFEVRALLNLVQAICRFFSFESIIKDSEVENVAESNKCHAAYEVFKFLHLLRTPLSTALAMQLENAFSDR